MDLADPLFVIPEKKHNLDDLLKSRKRCADEIDAMTRRSFSAPQEGGLTCAYIKGAMAALLLLDRKIALAMNQAIDAQKFMQVANKMVITTSTWYVGQKQGQNKNV